MSVPWKKLHRQPKSIAGLLQNAKYSTLERGAGAQTTCACWLLPRCGGCFNRQREIKWSCFILSSYSFILREFPFNLHTSNVGSHREYWGYWVLLHVGFPLNWKRKRTAQTYITFISQLNCSVIFPFWFAKPYAQPALHVCPSPQIQDLGKAGLHKRRKDIKSRKLRGTNKHWRGKENVGPRQSPKCLHLSEGWSII